MRFPRQQTLILNTHVPQRIADKAAFMDKAELYRQQKGMCPLCNTLLTKDACTLITRLPDDRGSTVHDALVHESCFINAGDLPEAKSISETASLPNETAHDAETWFGGLKKSKSSMTLFLRQKGKCWFCDQTLDPEKDIADRHHVIHKKHGGSNGTRNLRLVHRKCHVEHHRMDDMDEAADEGTS